MLALKNLRAPLDETTKDQLFEVGEQLELDPDDWEFIQEGLMVTIDANLDLSQPFQAFLTQLNATDSTILPQLLPTKDELAEILSKKSKLEIRKYGVGSSEPHCESLDDADNTILPQLLPTENELTEILSKNNDNDIEIRDLDSDEPYFKSKEIINITIRVLKDNRPPAMTQQYIWLDRIVNLMN